MTHTYTISGMTCKGCQAKVQQAGGTIVVRISQESLKAYANEHPEAKAGE